jgi:hypothetical protein
MNATRTANAKHVRGLQCVIQRWCGTWANTHNNNNNSSSNNNKSAAANKYKFCLATAHTYTGIISFSISSRVILLYMENKW